MEAVYRVFMYILPYAISLALYVWIFRKAQRVLHKVYKYVALGITIAGFCYTVYNIVQTAGGILTDENFHFQIMIVTVIVLFFASISMALGEPEK